MNDGSAKCVLGYEMKRMKCQSESKNTHHSSDKTTHNTFLPMKTFIIFTVMWSHTLVLLQEWSQTNKIWASSCEQRS